MQVGWWCAPTPDKQSRRWIEFGASGLTLLDQDTERLSRPSQKVLASAEANEEGRRIEQRMQRSESSRRFDCFLRPVAGRHAWVSLLPHHLPEPTPRHQGPRRTSAVAWRLRRFCLGRKRLRFTSWEGGFALVAMCDLQRPRSRVSSGRWRVHKPIVNDIATKRITAYSVLPL